MSMKLEQALRFATSVSEDIKREDTEDLLREFFQWLTRCPVCDGEGTLTFARDVNGLKIVGNKAEKTIIEAGTASDCPQCTTEDGENPGDANWISWVCIHSENRFGCRSHGSDAIENERHSKCGYRIVLPLDFLAKEA